MTCLAYNWIGRLLIYMLLLLKSLLFSNKDLRETKI